MVRDMLRDGLGNPRFLGQIMDFTLCIRGIVGAAVFGDACTAMITFEPIVFVELGSGRAGWFVG